MRKKKSTIALLATAFIMIIGLMIPLTVAYADTGLDTELVANGGAELGGISSWVDDTGQSRWNSSGAYSDWAPPAGGSNYFYLYCAGMDNLAGTMSQEIALAGTEGSGLFASISAGNISMKFSISMYQRISTDNEVKAILEEYTADGTLLKTSQVVNISSSGTMGSYQINTQVNPATRKFKVILSATLTNGSCAQFDQVSLKLVNASAGSAPVFGSDFPASGNTDAGVPYTANFSISDADAGDVDKLVFTSSSTNANLVPAANVTVSGSGSSRTLRIAPTGNLSGEADITVTASDGTKSAEKTLHFVVNKVISMDTNLVENGDGTSGLAGWSGNTVNITATGTGFHASDPSSSMSQNVDISKFSSLINGGQTDFLLSASFPDTYAKISAQFYTNIACTNPIGSSFDVTKSAALPQQKIPAGAMGVKITFSNMNPSYADVYVNGISFKIVNNFPKIAPVSAQTTKLSALTVPVYAYYTTANATLTATSSDQTIVANGGISAGGSGFSRSVSFTPLKAGNVTISLLLNDGSKSASGSFVVTAYDPAKVTNISSPASGVYATDGTLDFTVQFNHSITGGTGSSLPLTIGGNPATAPYLSRTSDSITYRYTIGSSDSGAVALGTEIDDTSSPITDTSGFDAEMGISGGATGITIVQAPQLTSSAASITYGTRITLTAALDCAESLTGSVQFKADGTNLGSPVAVSGNEASYQTAETELAAGSRSITAEFIPSGSNIYFSSLTSDVCTVTVGQKTVSVSGFTATPKAYDGSATVALNGGTLDGTISGDTVSADYPTAGTAAQKDAGTHSVTFAPIELTGAHKDNYVLSAQPSLSVVISPKQVTASATVGDKPYDSNTNATVTGVVFDGLASGESLASGVDYTASGVFTSADAGNGVSATVSVALTGTDAAKNYTLSSNTANAAADIAQKTVAITGVSATNRPYNGTASVALTDGALSGIETADAGDVNFNLGTGAIADANAGYAKPISTNITLTGGKAGNYSLTQPASITVDIGKAPLYLQSAVVSDKVYDGSTNATVTGAAFSGLVSGESLTFGVDYTASGVFASADSDNNLSVSVSAALTATDMSKNYIVLSSVVSASATITPKAVTISGVSATNRAYNGTRSVALTGGALSGIESADTGDVNFNRGMGVIADAKTGSAKPVSTDITLTGGKAGNYSLTQPTGLSVDIGKAPLSLHSAVVSDKVYDGNTNAAVTSVTFDGLAPGEALISGTDYTASGVFANAGAGQNRSVTVSAILADTDMANNYEVSGTGSAAADITPYGITGALSINASNTTGNAGLIDEGDVLTVGMSGISAPGALTVSYQWYRNGAAIPGATSASYRVGPLSADPAGTSLTVKVTGTGNYAGMLESAATVVSKIQLVGGVVINGTAALGSTLTLNTAFLIQPGATYNVSWLRDGVVINGATGGSYTVTEADLGKTVSVLVTATGYYTGVMNASIIIPAADPYVPELGIVNQGEQASVDLTMGSTLLSGEQTSQLISLNATEPVVLSGGGYTITFPQGSMSAASGGGSGNGGLDMGVAFNSGDNYGSIRSQTGGGFVMMLDFNHSGPLPGEAQIRLFVGTQYAGHTMLYQYFNPQTQGLEILQRPVADSNGYITVTQDHCSTYVVTLYDPDVTPETGDHSSNLVWWLLAGLSAAGILGILSLWIFKKRSTGHNL